MTESQPLPIDDENWRNYAACRDSDPDLFFPIGTTGAAAEQIEAAKAVCRKCEARPFCLEFALLTNQESGIWGATDEEERRRLRKAWIVRQRRGPQENINLPRRPGSY